MIDARKQIVIAAGGTAGHVVPALAVAQALQAEGVSVTFIGAGRAEAQLVPAAGFALENLAVEGLDRRRPWRALRALGLAARAVPRARALLAELSPAAVMGGGGYAAAPVLVAALTLRVPYVLTEADSRLGLTNRLLAPFASRVCLSFPPAHARPARARLFSRRRRRRAEPRYRVTGRPMAPAAADRASARAHFGVAPDETLVLVFGGSLGARSINHAAREAFRDASLRVLHISGARDYEELAEQVPPSGSGYELRELLEPVEFDQALAAADLAVARAGGSVFELAAAGIPSVLVPYPHATADHQSGNARWMANGGAAIVIPDSELDGPRLAREVGALLSSESRLESMTAAARKLARVDAADRIADEVLRLAHSTASSGRALA
jgi:UDP-N-acetylglucosamine--N-acetylmuramyl-(pentapeptide) pyrophosphoryl-undecaprenol N-acetylglucosamine transferase